MKPLQAACDRLLRAFSESCKPVEAVIQRAAESPPSRGYEPWLVERGHNPILARMMAAVLVRRGNRVAKESVRLLPVINALRFLADQRHKSRAKSRRVAVLLTAWEGTSIIETIFGDAGLDEFEFIQLLKSAAEGHEEAYHRLTELAASLAPHLSIPRGPKVRAVSAAHEFFLENAVMRMKPSAFSWNESKGEFTDPVTEATRREFGHSHFNPRPACRRLKARQRRN
jgi:hypothetical protein